MMTECVVTGFSSTLLSLVLPDDAGVAAAPAREQRILPNASFCALHAPSKSLYAVHETNNLSGEGIVSGGGLSRWTRDDGQWIRRQLVPSGGDDPTHVALQEECGLVWVCNYSGGSVSAFKVDSTTGALNETAAFTASYGKGSMVDKDRQEASHPHGAFFLDDLAMVVDLGQDCIHMYRSAKDGSTVTPISQTPLGPGYGPRHLTVDPIRKRVFVLNELKTLLSVFSLDVPAGKLTKITEVVFTVDGANPETRQYGAGIALSADGRFLYISNRGDGAVVVFKVLSAEDGCLAQIQCQRLSGTWPRFFLLLPGGERLVTADQFNEELQMFNVDEITGMLSGGEKIPAQNNPSSIVII